jgi:uncharacterized protein
MRSDPVADELAELESGGLDDIEETECWRLLATQPVGRVAVIVGHYPLIFPVNHAVEGRYLVFRTAPGTKLWATTRSNVTFEVDAFDMVRKTGWSVLVRGVAREVSVERQPAIAKIAERAAPQAWAPGDREHIVRIVADSISGRRIRLADVGPSSDPRGYL